MTGKVIHLAFKSPHVIEDSMAFVACAHCQNKTFTPYSMPSVPVLTLEGMKDD